MLRYVSLLFLVFGVALAKDSFKAPCVVNNGPFLLNATFPQISISCQASWEKLDVVIDGGDNTQGGLSLDFASVANFKSNMIKISAVTDGNDTPIYSGTPNGIKFWMVTGQKKIRIQADFEPGASIAAEVMLKCGGTFDLPTFKSPLLPNRKLPTPVTVTCDFSLTKPATIEFTKFTLAKTSEAKFTGTVDDSLCGPFSDKAPDHMLIVATNSVFSLKLDLSDQGQEVSFNRQIVSGQWNIQRSIPVFGCVSFLAGEH